MKGALRLSVLINFVLAAGLAYSWHKSLVTETPLVAPSWNGRGSDVSNTGTGMVDRAKAPQEREGVRFQWSQIESTDYQTYVAKLRSIGCPEQTIRDIVKADLHTLYTARLAQLASEGKREECQYVRNDESSALEALLGPEPKALKESRVRPTRAESPIARPLVFETVDPRTAGLTDKQAEIFERLRQTFIEEIGSHTDPSDPSYRDRWQAAQRNSDDLLQGLLGGEFYMEYQLKASGQPQSR